MSDRGTTFHYAEEYVQRGYAVIPLVGKIPPARFRWSRYQRRRATLAEISSWFGAQSPCRYNIGIVTGTISGLEVVDIDCVGDVDWWTEKFPTSPLAAVTGRGGVHLYYRANPLAPIRNRAGVHGRKIDIRGDGGYVVAPPSIHADTGKDYQTKRTATRSGASRNWGTRSTTRSKPQLTVRMVEPVSRQSPRQRSTFGPIVFRVSCPPSARPFWHVQSASDERGGGRKSGIATPIAGALSLSVPHQPRILVLGCGLNEERLTTSRDSESRQHRLHTRPTLAMISCSGKRPSVLEPLLC